MMLQVKSKLEDVEKQLQNPSGTVEKEEVLTHVCVHMLSFIIYTKSDFIKMLSSILEIFNIT